MGVYLVVANRTLDGPHLVGAVRRRAQRDSDCRIHIVVPHHEGGRDDPLEEDLAAVHARLASATEAFVQAGAAEVTSELVGETPVDAVQTLLPRIAHVEEVLLSTFPLGASRWLRRDVPRRLGAAVDVPVTHLVADDGRPHPKLLE